MKKISFVVLLIFLSLISCKTVKQGSDSNNEEILQGDSAESQDYLADYSEQSTWLLGYFERNRFSNEPHFVWYIKEYDDYMPKNDVISQLKGISKEDLKIKIVLGTWCPDSRREVPRFMRILDLWQFPDDKLTFIGVDNAKLSPVGEYEGLDIQRVPTFIIYKKNIEAGRIIENPTTSLEQDIVNILNRND